GYNLDTKSTNVLSGTLSAYSNQSSPLTFQLLSEPQHGTLKLTDLQLGLFTYTPDNGYTGPDSFTYNATQGGLTSNTATVNITVQHSGGGGMVSVLGLLFLSFAFGFRKLSGLSRDPKF
ncbi:MAG: Ig-like domain-containing protein, partial [Gammaproteobacteria bacterium]